MCETNRVLEANFRCAGVWISYVLIGGARATNNNGDKAETENHSEAGNGHLVSRGTKDTRSQRRELQCRGSEQAQPGAIDRVADFGAARSKEGFAHLSGQREYPLRKSQGAGDGGGRRSDRG